MPTFAELSQQQKAPEQQAQQSPTLRVGGGSNGPYIEPPELRSKWKALVDALGGNQGAEIDLPMRWTGLKTPAEVRGWDDNTKTMVVKYPKTNPSGTVTQGCRLTLEVTEPGLEGLRFYPDGAYSLHPTTALFRVTCAAAKRTFGENETVRPSDHLGGELIATVRLGKAVAVKEDGSHVNKGGHYWSVKGFRQVPVKVTFGQQAPAPAPNPTPEAASTFTASSQTSAPNAPLAALDDDDDFKAPWEV